MKILIYKLSIYSPIFMYVCVCVQYIQCVYAFMFICIIFLIYITYVYVLHYISTEIYH